MKLLLILPIILPLTTAAVGLLCWRSIRAQQVIGLLGAGGLLAAAGSLLHGVWQNGPMALQLGNWPAPFGITLAADLFSAIMVVLAALMGFTVALYSLATVDPRRVRYGYFCFYHFLLMGVCGVFLTGDLFNMYVWFEVMLMASFVLMALGGEKEQLEGAIKYVTLNLISSAVFLTGLGILYGMSGTLNMAHLATVLPQSEHPFMVTTVAMLFLVAFGIKSAVFPLFFWLPASYHTPPVAVSAIFAGLLTKVGVYSLMRVFTLLFMGDVAYTHTLILIIAGFTMVTGVLGAAAQGEFRRILSFHIISQVGYMIMGLGLFTPLALTGSVFYIMHHIVVKTNLFLVSGVARLLGGSYRLERLGGLSLSAPGLSLLFAVSAFSLAGIPPLSGFWAKLILIIASFKDASYLIAATALLVSLLTLFSMTKIWAAVFWGEPAVAADPQPLSGRRRAALYVPIILLALITVTIGLGTGPILTLAERTADQLIDPRAYIRAVLGSVQ